MRLAQDPHEFGHHGLCGHIVSLQHLQIGFQAVAHMVDADVAALAGDLRCEDDEPPFRHPVPQAVKKAALLRQAAHAEALNDKRVISLQQKVGGGAVLPRRQLQKRYPGIQRVEKYRGGMAVLPDITQKHTIPQNAQIGIVDAGKGLKALGAGLAGTGA